jgi:hypothetical protein
MQKYVPITAHAKAKGEKAKTIQPIFFEGTGGEEEKWSAESRMPRIMPIAQ